jgi:signal transduction histidine kinase
VEDLASIISAGTSLSEEFIVGLQELQRLAEFGRLSAQLLHEISNPLTAAVLYLDQHQGQSSTGIRHARRNIRLLQRYVEAARQQARQTGQPVDFYVRPQIGDIRRVMLPLARQAGVSLRIMPTANYRLFGDPVKFQQIVANLIANAIDAYSKMSKPPSKKLVQVTFDGRNEWLLAQIRDWGTGIDSDKLPRVFDPFYTTKNRSGGGLGIGLALVKQYVEQDFNGSVKATSTLLDGTVFSLKLRVAPAYPRT